MSSIQFFWVLFVKLNGVGGERQRGLPLCTSVQVDPKWVSWLLALLYIKPPFKSGGLMLQFRKCCE